MLGLASALIISQTRKRKEGETFHSLLIMVDSGANRN